MNPRSFDDVDPLWMRVEPYLIGENTAWLLTASYPVRIGLDDATHEILLSEDLLSGEWNPGEGPHSELIGDTLNNGDGTHTLTIRDASASTPNRFIKLQVKRL